MTWDNVKICLRVAWIFAIVTTILGAVVMGTLAAVDWMIATAWIPIWVKALLGCFLATFLIGLAIAFTTWGQE